MVTDVKKPTGDLFVVHLNPKSGTLEVGKKYIHQIDTEFRSLVERNHTATHLLHWALREVLGKHIKQAGSLVNAESLRFDFSHYQALTPDELLKVENLINEKIWADGAVQKRVMAKDQAIATGAIAFFGDKYGDQVRVVQVGDYSTELCGGTHVDRASNIHIFKIISESGIAAGVRRIIAQTSKGAFEFLRARDEQLKKVRDEIKVNSSEEIIPKIGKLQQVEKDLRKELEAFKSQGVRARAQALFTGSKTMGGVKLICANEPSGPEGSKNLRDLCDHLKQMDPSVVVVLSVVEPESGKVHLLVGVGTQAQAIVKANELLSVLSGAIGGRGGGKADLAQAGGTNAAGIGSLVGLTESFVFEKTQEKSKK
jgi:alanyl-tRNA synthetase